MLCLSRRTLASPNTNCTTPGCLLLKPQVRNQLLLLVPAFSIVFNGMLVATVEKFGENALFHVQCLGSVSPAISVFDRPSVTSEKRIARKCRAIIPGNSPASEPAPG